MSALEGTMRDAIQGARGAIDARGFGVELSVPPQLPLPRCPPEKLAKAVTSMLLGVSAAGGGGGRGTLRCEKKPVLLRGRNGEEIRRDFVLIALAHGATIPAPDQQRVLTGSDQGALGEAWRLVREMGGFVRFAPLPNGLETRLFLPAV